MARERNPALIGERSFTGFPRRLRARRGGETILDTERALLVWEPEGRPYPSLAVPAADLRADGLPTWGYDDPELAGYVTVPWDAADGWLEEDEEMLVHPRDPFARIDVVRSTRHVEVAVGGEIFADSTRPLLLFETGLPVRHYLPREDVRLDRLVPSPTRTRCPYKGEASYWSVGVTPDVAWAYDDPLTEVGRIAGRVAFFAERAEVTVDGAPVAPPRTPWATR